MLINDIFEKAEEVKKDTSVSSDKLSVLSKRLTEDELKLIKDNRLVNKLLSKYLIS